MFHLHAYLIRQQTVSLFMVLLGLLIIVWLNHSLKVLELVVNKSASFTAFFKLSFLPLPLWLMVALPLACFCAIIWVIYRLVSDRELVVMQAAGISPIQFAIAPILFGLATTFILFVNSIILLPNAFSIFKQTQFEVRASIPKVLIQDKVFVDLGKDLTLYINKRKSEQEVNQVFIQDSRTDEVIVTYTSESGAFKIIDNRPVFILTNGQRVETRRGSSEPATLNFATHSLDISQQTDGTNSRFIDANEESIADLMDRDKAETDFRFPQRLAMAHYRLAAPLQAVALALLASAIMLVGRLTRANIIRRMVIAAIAGILLQTFVVLTRGMIADIPQSWPLIYLASLAPAIMCLAALLRPEKTARTVQSLFRFSLNSGSQRA